MKTVALWAIILFLSILIQASFLSVVFGVNSRPDLMLIVAVSAGILGGRETWLGIGFFAGLIQDLSSGNVFGLNVLSKMAVGYVSGLLESKVFKENIFLPAISAIVATLLNELIVFIFLYFLGYKLYPLFFITNQFALRALYTLIIAIPVHKLIYCLISVDNKN